jgi:hypothetical protein
MEVSFKKKLSLNHSKEKEGKKKFMNLLHVIMLKDHMELLSLSNITMEIPKLFTCQLKELI